MASGRPCPGSVILAPPPRPRTHESLVKKHDAPGLWLEDVPEPEIGINDVLIKVVRTGICGTDVHIYNWDAWAQKTMPVPMVVGHEFVGEIVEVGLQRQGFPPRRHRQRRGARRLRPLPQLPGRPAASLQGHPGHRREPPRRLRRVPRAADDQRLAPRRRRSTATSQSIFDPFGNAVHTALSFRVLGEDVLITGAGPIGFMAAAVVKHAGARYVVDHRREPVPPGTGAKDGRDAGRRRPHEAASPTCRRNWA